MARGAAVSVVQTPARIALISIFIRPLELRTTSFAGTPLAAPMNSAFSNMSEKFSRRRDLHESGAVIPHQTEGGTRESSFTSNRRFLRRKLLSGTAGESRSLIEK
jgi:hypothetical protein